MTTVLWGCNFHKLIITKLHISLYFTLTTPTLARPLSHDLDYPKVSVTRFSELPGPFVPPPFISVLYEHPRGDYSVSPNIISFPALLVNFTVAIAQYRFQDVHNTLKGKVAKVRQVACFSTLDLRPVLCPTVLQGSTGRPRQGLYLTRAG